MSAMAAAPDDAAAAAALRARVADLQRAVLDFTVHDGTTW